MADGDIREYIAIATQPSAERIECAACGAEIQRCPGHPEEDSEPGVGHSINRDGFCIGPEVPLCCDCGAHEFPSCSQLWRMIARRGGRA